MQKQRAGLPQILTALVAAGLILLATSRAADAVWESRLVQQSRLVRLILSQDSVGFTSLITDADNIGVLTKFLGAVTTAYINFEMIPVGEASTFAAIFESLSENIRIEQFSYHGRTLVIDGIALSEEDYEAFRDGLENHGQFRSVSGHDYTTTDDEIRFEIECAT